MKIRESIIHKIFLNSWSWNVEKITKLKKLKPIKDNVYGRLPSQIYSSYYECFLDFMCVFSPQNLKSRNCQDE